MTFKLKQNIPFPGKGGRERGGGDSAERGLSCGGDELSSCHAGLDFTRISLALAFHSQSL